MAQTQQARNPHLAIEALRKLLNEESTRATRTNIVRQRVFSERIVIEANRDELPARLLRQLTGSTGRAG